MTEITIFNNPARRRLWQTPEQTPHPDLATLFEAKNQLIVLRHGDPPFAVVIGVPHQVPNGVWRICDERRDSNGRVKDRSGDDNVASLGLLVFSQLHRQNIPCKLVIMAHATTHDPNKVLDSPYCQEVFQEKMHLLFECHASSGRRRLDLELSAGSNRVTRSLFWGQKLAARLENRYRLGVQVKAGRRDAVVFLPNGSIVPDKLDLPAIKTASLIEAGRRSIAGLYLETKPIFRVVDHMANAVTPDGLILGRAIAATIISRS
ncbi:MAG: hypothetical protein R3264_04805 [Anaerolineae bacterium]|nr:hypothetical protein [Anaerolineae bacterium]